MLAEVVLGICALAGGVATIAFFRRQSAKSTRTVSVPEGAPAARWIGGVRTSTINGTSGTARLELFDWGVRVQGSGLLGKLAPTWEVLFSELRSAQLITWPIANSGVLMRTDGSAVPLVFVTRRGGDVLDALEARGVAVDRRVARLRLADLADAR